MRIDAHQHFWRYTPTDYAWIDDRMAVLKRDFLPEDLRPALLESELTGSIAVQARQDPAETRWLLELARENDFLRGVVGWVDLCAPAVAEELAALGQAGELCGVRHVVQDEPDDEFLLREDFCRGIQELRALDLGYDILIYPRQLPAAVRFVERFPEQVFVLDHMAKPSVHLGHATATDEFARWEEHVRALSQHPLVSCKVSGLVTEAPWNDWRPDDFKPYLDVVFDAFGEDRLLFGSDWPVCLLSAASHRAVYELVDHYASEHSPDARAKLFGANAARIYGLEDS